MEQKPKLKFKQCYRDITVAESLKHKGPRLLDLLQTPLTPESLEEAKERKQEIRRREEAGKEIELKNEFKKIHKEEKLKQKGQEPKVKKEKKMQEEILKIIKETREKWGIRSYEEKKKEWEEKKKQEEDFVKELRKALKELEEDEKEKDADSDSETESDDSTKTVIYKGNKN